MRRLLSVVVVFATTTLVPMFTMAGNQEVADQIAQNLRGNGNLSDYHIAVKFQDGTATVKGRVASQEQMNTVMKIVYKTPGVSRVINGMTVGRPDAPAVAERSTPSVQRVASSYTNSPVRTASATEPSKFPQQRLANSPPRPIGGRPMPVSMAQYAPCPDGEGAPGGPMPMYAAGAPAGAAPARYDQAYMPNYAWPSYAAYPNYAALTYPRQYSPTVWPYIGPFYPYPQVPLGWRKVTLEWKDGWWFLDFKDEHPSCFR